jgi:hypothetical protein
MQNEEIIKHGMEILESLYSSVYISGGSIAWFSLEKLKDMSAYDLITQLATNNIRFTNNGGDINEL